MNAPLPTDSRARYGRRAPCAHCPFRSDIKPFLRDGRARQIAAALRCGGEFICHKTTVSDDEGDLHDVPGRSQVCAGALATMEREGFINQAMRIAERLGLYTVGRFTADAPVYDSLTHWVRAHSEIPTVSDHDGTAVELEHCGIVGPDCEDPAGFGGSGGAYENDGEPTCSPLSDNCEGCGHTACAPCRSGQWGSDGQWCVFCASEGAT